MTLSMRGPVSATLLLLVNFFIQAVSAATLQITDAWIRYLPPVVPVRSGYMTINNNSGVTVEITDVESEVFTQVEIHETVTKDGMMSMRPVLPLEIPAGETVKLLPGGLHLMMMKPDRPLNPGSRVDVILHFDNNESQVLKMTVRKNGHE